MAAVRPINGIEPLSIQIGQYERVLLLYMCNPVNAWTQYTLRNELLIPDSVGQCSWYDYGLVCRVHEH